MARAGGGRLAEVVADQASCARDHPWVESARSDRVVRRGELAALVDAWTAQGLAGRRIGLATADPVAFAALFVALVAAGVTVVPVDAAAPPESTAALLRTAGAERVVVTDPAVLPGEDQLLVDADRLLPVPTAEATRASPVRPAHRDGAGDGTTGASLLFSSGSTGPRKAIRLPEAQLLHVARAVAGAHALTGADRGFNPLPLFHVNAEVVALLGSLVSGGTVVLDDRFHRTGFWELVRERSITWINAVPAIIAILGSDEPGQGPDGTSRAPAVRFVRSASAPLPVPVLQRFEASCGIPVVETYGMTEAASQITANPLDAARPGTVGLPVDVELRVVDEGGAPVAPGADGRVQLRGPGVITAYEGGRGAEQFTTDGWLDTGDVGSLDADGYLALAGRSGDIINRGGEKIFPREVEEVLRQLPGVAEAVVVGREDPVLGQVPVAYVIPAAGAPDDLAEQLAQRCATSLERSRRPVDVIVVPDLPRGPTGKIARRRVAEADRG